MKLKLKRMSVARKTTPARGSVKVVKRPSLLPVRVIKAKVLGLHPARKPALPGKAAVLAALKKKQRAEQERLARVSLAAAKPQAKTAAQPNGAAQGNIVQMPENAEEAENDEP